MLKKLAVLILIIGILAFTTFGQSISLQGKRASQKTEGSTAQTGTTLNTASVGQLATQMGDTSAATAVSTTPDPQGIDARSLVDAGRALESFRNNFYIGFLLDMGGVVLMLTGAASYPPNGGLVLAGAIVSIVGEVWELLSYNSIGVAGERLVKAGGGD